jgi:hypothetical protein
MRFTEIDMLNYLIALAEGLPSIEKLVGKGSYKPRSVDDFDKEYGASTAARGGSSQTGAPSRRNSPRGGGSGYKRKHVSPYEAKQALKREGISSANRQMKAVHSMGKSLARFDGRSGRVVSGKILAGVRGMI